MEHVYTRLPISYDIFKVTLRCLKATNQFLYSITVVHKYPKENFSKKIQKSQLHWKETAQRMFLFRRLDYTLTKKSHYHESILGVIITPQENYSIIKKDIYMLHSRWY